MPHCVQDAIHLKVSGAEVAGVRELAELIKLLPKVEIVIATGSPADSVADQMRAVIGGRQLMICGSPIQRGKPRAGTVTALADVLDQARARLS